MTVTSNGRTSTIEVTDNGPGLTDEELARIGDRFWRSNRHQNVDGSGLGLSIARALLSQGGGTIEYAHREPHGLAVSVTVPARAPGEARSGGRTDARASPSGSSAPRRRAAAADR